MLNRLIAILLLAVFLGGIATPLATTHASSPYDWNKIDPRLAELFKNPAGEYEVIVKLKEAPREILLGKPHDLVVSTLKDYARSTQAPIKALVQSRGGEILNTFWILNAVLVKADANTILMLTTFDNVERIFPNYRITIDEPTSKLPIQPDADVESWGIYRVHAPEAWAMGYTGEGVRIAVLDTGVDITHPALAGKMLTLDPTDPHYPGGWMEWDGSGNLVCSEPHDTHGHGTHTSGTALGGDTENILIGVAPGATLMHGLVLPGGGGTFAQVIAGMEWTVEPYDCDGNPTGLPAHVVSMSWGASGYYGNDLLPAIENMLLAGVIPVAAIGNDGQGISSNPGNIWGVFGVGATAEDDSVAYFSSGEIVNWPDPPASWPFFGGYPSTYMKPDFSAPGVNIVSAVPGGGYEAWAGTSMATPHVAGAVALVLQAMDALDFESPVPDLSLPELVYTILNQTADDLGDPGQDTGYGWGIINAFEAAQLATGYAKNTGVTGFVTDAVTGEPVTWATVFVQETGKTYGVNASGGFRIPLDPGTYHLTFSAWGFENVTVEVEVVAGNGTIAGIVYDALTSAPIAGAAITVLELNETVYTDTNGTFSISVPAGTYTLTVEATGYESADAVVNVVENETTIVTFPLMPAGNGTIKGYVVDADTFDPIPNATVVAAGTGGTIGTTTDLNGYFEMIVPAGVYDVYATAPGYIPESVSNVTVPPNTEIMINFTLAQVTPTIVIVGNSYGGHIDDLLVSAGVPSDLIVTYMNITDLIADWSNGTVFPKVVIVDHWFEDPYTNPDNTTILNFIALAEISGTEVLFLDAGYSGYTGGKGLIAYNSELEALGYPAPDDSIDHYPSPEYIKVVMLDPANPLFDGVVPDNDSWFYLADLANSDYADYSILTFSDDDFASPIYLANITDEYYGESGIGIVAFFTPAGNTWLFLSSWAESYWMQYTQPGSDGMYSNNTATVLVNAASLLYITSTSLDPAGVANAINILKAINTKPFTTSSDFIATGYTVVNVSLNRLPYGFIEGTVTDTSGMPLAGAKISISGAPFTLVTDANGTFSTWLPVGTYNITASMEGYIAKTVTVSISENATTAVSFALEEAPRIAILYDFAGELKALIKEYNPDYYVKDFDDIDEFIAEISTGFYWGAIVSGYYGTPMPTSDQFFAMLDAMNSNQMSVIWLGNWGSYGYGIRMLNVYLNDPATITTGWGEGALYYEILVESPLFGNYTAGDTVEIIWDPSADWMAFDGFSGTTLANLHTESGGLKGYGAGIKYTDAGTTWILMASMAPEQWTDVYYWTEDGIMFFLNGVKMISVQKIGLELNATEVHVGDTIEATIYDAPANTTFTITVAGVELGNVTTDANGTASFTFTVPLLPMGTYGVTTESLDGMYLGIASFKVTPSITVVSDMIAQGKLATFNITGLPANGVFQFAIDDNMITTFTSDENGVAVLNVNIPLFVEQNIEHRFKVVIPENGTKIACIKATVYPGYILEILEQILNNTGASTGLTSEILSKLDQLGLLINTTAADLANLIESGNANLTALITTKSGDILAVLDTINGTMIAKFNALDEAITSNAESISDTITSSKTEIIDTVTGSIDDAKNEVINAIGSLNETISSSTADIKDNMPSSTSTNAAAAMATLAFLASLGAVAMARRG